ncbi:MAG: MFS transporter [Bacillaceae bacterium]|nr:MFS transporter [Bacillaceae bacterium]
MDKRLIIIASVLVNIFIGFGLVIPVMPMMVEEAGAAPFHLGMMLSIYSAVSFVVSPLWGALSDRIGRRPVIMSGLFGFSISFFLFGISGDNLWLMYISRILGGIFSGAATSSAIAYIADITTDEERTKAMGLAGASIGLGFIFGPAMGGLLSVFGYATPYFASSVLSLINLFFAMKMLEESLSPEKRAETRTKEKTSRWAAFSGALKYLYLLSFFVTFTLAGLESTLQYFEVKKIQATSLEIGIMFAISGIVGAVIQGGVVRKLVKKGQEGRTIMIGLIVSGLGFLLIIFSADFWTATLFVAIFGAGNALIRPCVTSLITQKTTVGQGVASGLISSMDSLGRIAGPLLGTALFQVDIRLPFVSGGLLSFAAITLLIGFYASTRRESTLAGEN